MMDQVPTPRLFVRYLPPFMVAVVAMLFCWWAGGATLGLFFAGVIVATLTVPPLVAYESAMLRRLLVGGAVVDGVGVVWLAAVFTPALSLVQWIIAYLLIAMYAASLVCVVHLLTRWRVAPVVASFLVMLVGGAWLLWPIWLSPVVSADVAAMLTSTHPLMALNALLSHLGLWSEQAGTIYHMTTLNQDIPHRLPDSPWPAIVFHAMVALGACLIRTAGKGRNDD